VAISWTFFFWVALWMGGAALLAAWARGEGWQRNVTTLVFLASLPITFFGVMEVLGNHRPVTWEQVRGMGEKRFVLLGSKMLQDEGIYLYLDHDVVPLALELPWDEDLAQKLQDALKEMRKGGPNSQLEVIIPPYEFSWDDQKPPQFNPLPQPKFLPDKPPEEDPLQYDRDA
jgi:hypothetical protein